MSLSKRNKILLAVIFIGLVVGYFVISYAYQPHKTLDERSVKFTGTVEEFTNKVAQDATPWQDVVVELSGKVTSIDDNGFTLNDNTFCQLENTEEVSKITLGKTLKIKARIIGYDDLLEELKLDQTKIIN
ncbi:hypothetical protein [Oceanihabitans sediminis]|uniref:hypothetical protein n=1 Tax=Oceanihabitans sediminis TaxID=1812012 RepID=UPI00299ED917|nr:hypothetical protein [Oceanihabitans sediminis]MDX1774158.1 hypothetical protein [Oceanihabitans sediminis]